MSSRVHAFQVANNVDVPETAINTETVIATLPNVSSEFPGQTVAFICWAAITGGTGLTGMTLRVRRDTLTGAVVNEVNANAGDIVAAKLSALMLQCTDPRTGDFSGSYVLTMQATGEAAVSTSSAANITALVS